MLAGITHAFQSPYLLNIGLFLLLFAMTSTFLYFQQADIVSHELQRAAARRPRFSPPSTCW